MYMYIYTIAPLINNVYGPMSPMAYQAAPEVDAHQLLLPQHTRTAHTATDKQTYIYTHIYINISIHSIYMS